MNSECGIVLWNQEMAKLWRELLSGCVRRTVRHLHTPKGFHITAQGRDAGAHPGKHDTVKPNPEGVVHLLARCRTPSGFVLRERSDPGCATGGRDPGL